MTEALDEQGRSDDSVDEDGLRIGLLAKFICNNTVSPASSWPTRVMTRATGQQLVLGEARMIPEC